MGKFSLLTTLTLNASGYNKGINQAKQKTEDLKKTTQRISGVIKKAMSFAGIGLGIAAVMKGVKESINSVQSSGDAFHNTMAAAKEATNALFQSIATLTFGDLISNMENAAEAGRIYAEALDDIGDRQRSVGIHSKKAKLEIKKLEAQLTNLNLTTKERQAVVDEVNRLTLEQFKKEENLAKQRLDAEKERFKSKHTLSDKEVDDLQNYIENYQNLTKLEYDALKDATLAYQALSKIKEGTGRGRLLQEQWDKQKENLSEQQLRFVMLGDTINKISDVERDHFALVVNGWLDAQIELVKYTNKAERAQQEIDRANKAAIDALKDKIIYTEKLNKIESLGGISITGSEPNTSILDTMFDADFATKAAEYEKKIENFMGNLKSIFQDGLIDAGITFAEGIGELFVTGDIVEFGKSFLNSIANFMSNLAAQMITFATMSIGFATAIAAIKKFMVLNPIIAIVSAVTLLALAQAFRVKASESFAQGGIVGGSSYSGDLIPARVNSGEMILNQAQQRNLFSLANGGGGGGVLTTRINGDDLEFILNKNQRKRNSFR